MIFTTADSSCPAVASLLQLERAAGSYLAGLGPASVAGGSGSGGARRAPFVARGGKGARGQLAPRALVLIDASTGCRWALPRLQLAEPGCLPGKCLQTLRSPAHPSAPPTTRTAARSPQVQGGTCGGRGGERAQRGAVPGGLCG